MEFIYLIVIFAFAITFSNIVNRLVPILPSPVIQIILGVIIGLTKMGQDITFNPEIFLIMIIAPLLFREGELANIKIIMKDFVVILFLAFLGVLITLICVGWTLHLILPAIPIAVCFAFGSALGPTDAVAINSLSGRIRIPKRAMNVLAGESLINDASGVTAFQFALAALLTGYFSPQSAIISLIFSSIGGAFIGISLAWLKRQIVQILEKASAKDVSGYLLLELLLPFLAYMLAEIIGGSGIIAAVVAGVMQSTGNKKVALFEAELSNVTGVTWSMIEFTLNALVFLFLGIELSQVFSPVWNNAIYSNGFLFLVILIISIVLFGIRFLALIGIYSIKEGISYIKENINELLIITFGGVKGNVSLATIFILPLTLNGQPFSERTLLLFITACVILITIVISLIVLPFLTEPSEQEMDTNDHKQRIALLNGVIHLLKKQYKSEPKDEINVVIDLYQERIRELYTEQLSQERRYQVQELRAFIVSIEKDGLNEWITQHRINASEYFIYRNWISRLERSITKQLLSFVGFWLLYIRKFFSFILHPSFIVKYRRTKKSVHVLKKSEIKTIKQLFSENTTVILKSLENLKGIYDDDIVQFFINSRLETAKRFEQDNFVNTYSIQSESDYIKEVLIGYQFERRLIDEFEIAGKISFIQANEFRKNVNLLESYSIDQASSTVPLNRLLKRINKETENEN
ncbi:cation:proton antiporter [Melissococcus plutonius]|uniref:cation:proton antiporter n=1 Tax=Melissococcus plutonius TaxID=33970 RepID=UPI003C2DF992